MAIGRYAQATTLTPYNTESYTLTANGHNAQAFDQTPYSTGP